ncbi:MAG: aldo/keto reductase [Lachnospiraceae bacterium]
MIYKPYKEVSLSALGMGNMRLPVQADQPETPIDREKAQEMIDYALEQGINYFDTAYVYHNGESEKFLGEALKKHPRDSYYLATKFFILANPDYKAVFEEQLKRLQTDYIDFYLIHGIFDHTFQQYLDCGCIDYFLEQKKLGRIKYLGFSTHAEVDNMTTFADHHKWDFAQIQLNYFDWKYGTAKEQYEVLERREIPIIVMEPIRGGRLSSLTPEAERLLTQAHPDWSIASWALRFVKDLPQVQVVLSGMSTLDQIKDNLKTFDVDEHLTETDMELLMNACDIFHEQVVVPCTACRYCCDDCPVSINIPEFLKIFNAYKVDGPWALSELSTVDSKGQPADCISCGACTGHCPQSIDVPEIMGELADLIAHAPGR